MNGPITDGDVVTLQVPIHNYSVQSAASGFRVDFYAVPIDESGDSCEEPLAKSSCITGPPRSIGSAQPPSIPPRGTQTVGVDWDTTGRGPMSGPAGATYRFFVVVDQDNQIPNETHEWADRYNEPPTKNGQPGEERLIDPMTDNPETLEAGQNNQGWGGDIIVNAKSASGSPQAAGKDEVLLAMGSAGGVYAQPASPALSNVVGTRTQPAKDIKIGEDTIAVATEKGTLKRGVRVPLHEPVEVRVHVAGDDRSRLAEHVQLFDGDPDKGGKLIGHRIVKGIHKDVGSYVWMSWVPRDAGKRELHARVLERPRDAEVGNNKASIEVIADEDVAQPTARSFDLLPVLITSLFGLVLLGAAFAIRLRSSTADRGQAG